MSNRFGKIGKEGLQVGKTLAFASMRAFQQGAPYRFPIELGLPETKQVCVIGAVFSFHFFSQTPSRPAVIGLQYSMKTCVKRAWAV